jgi:hypothetical protein
MKGIDAGTCHTTAAQDTVFVTFVVSIAVVDDAIFAIW